MRPGHREKKGNKTIGGRRGKKMIVVNLKKINQEQTENMQQNPQ